MIQGRIYNIPAGIPFLRTLAASLLKGEICDGAPLQSVKIFLPTRRACRILQDVFLKECRTGKPLILPQLQALGDVDEEELSLSVAGSGFEEALEIPPALAPLKRRILMARLIMARGDFYQGFDRALELADALCRLMDQVYTENLDLSDLAGLVPEEFADHWQITLEFLEILSSTWPKILAEEQAIDEADRRGRLIRALAAFWRDNPPGCPVIVAGTTGSIPATAELLDSVAQMPEGVIVLPGLDRALDGESWEVLEETHPQYGLKHLLERLGVAREDVAPWPHVAVSEKAQARQVLARETMCPAQTGARWAQWHDDPESCAFLGPACEDLELYECATQQEEAQVITILLRSILEEPHKTACLVTPDRDLAARVAAAARRWDIEIDDSAGKPLSQTLLGQFVLLVTEVCETGATPSTLLALARHPLVKTGQVHDVSALDIALRGPKPATGFKGLRDHVKMRQDIPDTLRTKALETLENLCGIITPLSALYEAGRSVSLPECLNAHLAVCESLAVTENLWSGEAGTQASAFFCALLQEAFHSPALHPQDYQKMLEILMRGMTVRPAWGTTPRVRILGRLEARMIDADLVILGGLNEGVWPPDAGADPWMSRPMRKQFGLPGLDRATGLAAHDFVQGLCAGHVVLTRARRQGNAPSVPSRWLQRLGAVMQAGGLDTAQLLGSGTALEWARRLDHTDEFAPALRPAPTPPVSARPRRLSVTKVESWLRDPYSIYAGSILCLKALGPLEQPVDAALRGTVLHEILDRFVSLYPTNMPEDSLSVLQDLAQQTLPDDPRFRSFWEPRFERLACWYEAHECGWRAHAVPLLTEAKGETVLKTAGGDFILSGRADRIDRLENGLAAIIDYKSGGTFTQSRMKSGDLPQLLLEGLILTDGGFEGLEPMKTGYIGYWLMTGGREAGKTVALDQDLPDIISETRSNLCALIELFDRPETPYLSLPRPDQVPRFNDYLHLARVAEWSALEQQDQEAA